MPPQAQKVPLMVARTTAVHQYQLRRTAICLAMHTERSDHGTGKTLKPKTIVARSSEGNVRVQDIVRDYAALGREGLNELSTTSPLTDYIIEAYDSC